MPTSSETAGAVATLPAGVDLHARPAAGFVRAAMAFGARVSIETDERSANAKSLLAVLALGAKGGTTLRLQADGEDAAAAVATLAAVLAGLTE